MSNIDKDTERLNKILQFNAYLSSRFKVRPEEMSEEDLKEWGSLVKRYARDSIYKDIKKEYSNLQKFKKSLLEDGELELYYLMGVKREEIRKMRARAENKGNDIVSVFYNYSGIEEAELYMAMYKEAMKELESKERRK
jgi:hypothetical protein|nr:MAG TPA: hypothetical protein [Bacteriophage sp.]